MEGNFIQEHNFDVDVSESVNEDGKDLHITGIFLQSDIKNKNNRIYPEAIMDKTVGKYITEEVDKGSAVGELGHPNTPIIMPERISHKIVSLTKEGKNYVGKAKILSESDPLGKKIRNLLKEEIRLGVSSRGVAKLVKQADGVSIVQDNFKLATAADIVMGPSAPDAHIQAIHEQANWIEVNGIWVEEDLDKAKEVLDTKYTTRNKYGLLNEFFKAMNGENYNIEQFLND